MNLLEIENLYLRYGNTIALSLDHVGIPSGQIVGIIGPNGSGKSSLLKAIMGLIKLDSGVIRFEGSEVKKQLHRIAYVPQREGIDWDFPISVFELVLMGRYSAKSLFRRSSKEDKQKALEAIELMGLQSLKDRQIGQLSGGQQQRSLLARAIARGADLFLLDEPFAGVDAASEQTIFEILRKLRSKGKSVVLVHHDLYSAYKYFDHVLLLNNTLIASGPAAEVLNTDKLSQAYGVAPGFKLPET